MIEPTVSPTADELFLRWKQLLDGGTLATASFVAADDADLVGQLQARINSFLAERAAEVQDTLTAADDPPEPDGPPHVPGLTVLDRLGRGGMGVVYRVRDPLDREFALKLVRRGQLSAAGRARFLEEARAMARLDHPHVARVHSYGEHDGRPYFLMPIYPANLADRQADPAKAVRLMAAVADGVGHLHARGFVHRDLKPHNILLSATGEPAVSDFGLVKPVGGDDPEPPAGSGGSGSADTKPTGPRRSRTVAGAVMGTWRYMSPEQAAGLVHLANPRWDVWALGVILHELVTGQPPPSSEAPQRLLDPAEPDNPPPSAIKPGLDPKLERVIRKCLARDERERYPDGRAVAADLRRLTGAPRRRRRWLVSLTLLLLALVGVTAAVLLNRPADPDRPWKKMRDDLVAGREVTLIGETGNPTWSRVVAGEVFTKPYLEQDGAYSVDTTRVAHILLLPETGVDEYRLDAEVKQIGGEKSARFGVSVGRQTFPTPAGETAYQAEFLFNEHAVEAPNLPARGKWEANLANRTDNVHISNTFFLVSRVFPENRVAGQYDWRRIAAHVSPTAVSWEWEGQQVHVVRFPLDPVTERDLIEMAPIGPTVRPTFPPGGGVGLAVYGGNVSFRNVRIARAPPE